MGRFTRRSPQAVPDPPPATPSAPPLPSTDDAWRTLTLQIDLVKHAETKAAASLASSGVLGGLLYSLVSRQHPAQPRPGGVLFAVAASVTAVAVVTAAAAAGLALRPRLYRRQTNANLLFYGNIARRFGHDADAFGRDLAALLTDRQAMLSALAAQTLVNAHVAVRKYRSVNVAIIALLIALALLATTAVLGLTGG